MVDHNTTLPKLVKGPEIIARCPGCNGAISRFRQYHGNKWQVSNLIPEKKPNDNDAYVWYVFLNCSGCDYPGAATMIANVHLSEPKLTDFYPKCTERVKLPSDLPYDIKNEIREAEKCAEIGCYRAALALLRSALEKILEMNGFKEISKNGKKKLNLYEMIEEANRAGLLAVTLLNKVHKAIRMVGNNILHEPYRVVDQSEVEEALKYVVRIVEAFYDSREEAEKVLKEKGYNFASATDLESEQTTD